MSSLSDLKRKIDEGELSPQAALSQSLTAIEAHEDEIGAFVCRTKDPRAVNEGVLRGIAVGIKDIIDTSDLPTEMGSAIYKDWQPRADAPIVMMLKQAGATIVGKTTTTAFAAIDPTATLNPRNQNHTPGGSSSGSAAAVAAGMVPLAVGSQTLGSTIRPASFCGVAAIKPSYRLLPNVGVKCSSWTLDTLGLFAAGAEDLELALAVITGRPDLAGHRFTKPLQIGIVTQEFAGPAEAASETTLRMAAAAAERSGASVRITKLPDIFAHAWRTLPTILAFEEFRALAWEYQEHYDEIEPMLRAEMDRSARIPISVYQEAMQAATRARAAFPKVMADLDVLLTYSAPGAAPKGLESIGNARFNQLWTLLGVPCVNVPADVSEKGLPIGVQIVAPFGEDAKALAAARFLETALLQRR